MQILARLLPASIVIALQLPAIHAQALPTSDVPRAVFAPTTTVTARNVFRATQSSHGAEIVVDSANLGATMFAYRWHAPTQALQSHWMVAARPGRSATGFDVGDVMGDSNPEYAIAWNDGLVQILDASTRTVLRTFQTSAPQPFSIIDLAIRDVDSDGTNEIITAWNAIEIRDALGNLIASIQPTSAGSRSLTFGQMDADPALEVGVSNGQVFDSATGASQLSLLPDTSRNAVYSHDSDGDGRDEYFEVRGRTLTSWNVETQSLSATRDFANDIGGVAFQDLTADGVPEILVADSANTRIRVLRADDFTLLQTMQVAGFTDIAGIKAIDVIDVDGDGDIEILAATDSAQAPRILVIDPVTTSVVGQSHFGGGSFVGPAVSDFDGDGQLEIAVASRTTGGPFSGSRVYLLSAVDLTVQKVGGPAPLSSSYDANELRGADVDGDGSSEIVLTGATNRASIYVWDIASNGELQVSYSLTPSVFPEAISWNAGTVADIDGDGSLEALGVGTRIRSYQVGPDTLEWAYPPLASAIAYFSDFEIGDFDGDGAPEIAALEAPSGAIHLLDAATGVLRQVFAAPGAVLDLLPGPGAGARPRLLLGGLHGEALVIRDIGAGLVHVADGSFGTSRIDKVTAQGRVILTISDGAIHVRRGFGLPAWSTNASFLWSTSNARFSAGTAFGFVATTFTGLVGY